MHENTSPRVPADRARRAIMALTNGKHIAIAEVARRAEVPDSTLRSIKNHEVATTSEDLTLRLEALLTPTPTRRMMERVEDLTWLLDGGTDVEVAVRRCGFGTVHSTLSTLRRRGYDDLAQRVSENCYRKAA